MWLLKTAGIEDPDADEIATAGRPLENQSKEKMFSEMRPAQKKEAGRIPPPGQR